MWKGNEKDKWDRTEIVAFGGANRKHTGLESEKSKLRKKPSQSNLLVTVKSSVCVSCFPFLLNEVSIH
jgi:hypothetical protein